MGSSGITSSYDATITAVGAVGVESVIRVPWKGEIRRARATVTAGTGAPTVSLSFRVVAGAPSTYDEELAYSLTVNPLDSQEGINYELPGGPGADGYYGNAFVEVATSDATLDHTVEVQLKITGPSEPNAAGQGAH